jgi:hypothetical protein
VTTAETSAREEDQKPRARPLRVSHSHESSTLVPRPRECPSRVKGASHSAIGTLLARRLTPRRPFGAETVGIGGYRAVSGAVSRHDVIRPSPPGKRDWRSLGTSPLRCTVRRGSGVGVPASASTKDLQIRPQLRRRRAFYGSVCEAGGGCSASPGLTIAVSWARTTACTRSLSAWRTSKARARRPGRGGDPRFRGPPRRAVERSRMPMSREGSVARRSATDPKMSGWGRNGRDRPRSSRIGSAARQGLIRVSPACSPL